MIDPEAFLDLANQVKIYFVLLFPMPNIIYNLFIFDNMFFFTKIGHKIKDVALF